MSPKTRNPRKGTETLLVGSDMKLLIPSPKTRNPRKGTETT